MPTTTYMSLSLPDPTITIGPTWASMLNTAFTTLDAHDHSSGKGTQVPAAGLNINADVSWGSYNVTSLKSARFTSQSSPLGGGSDLSCLYVSGGDLYYNNSGGTQIKITTGGSVNVAGLTASNYARRAVSTGIVIGAADTDVWYDIDTTATRAITLPAAGGVTAGRFYVFSDTTGNSATNAITISRAGSDTIEGGTSVTIASAYASLMLISDGSSKWRVLRFSDWTKLNGASAPAAGALTTGNVLQVSGSSALTYGPLNLAGGANYVTGVLPAANHPSATTSALGLIQIGGDLTGNSTSQQVVDITGTGGISQVKCADLRYPNTISNPFFGHVARSTAGSGTTLTVYAQDANTTGNGGAVLVAGGARAGTGQHGGVQLALGGIGGTKSIQLESTQLSTGSNVLSLCAGVAVTTTNMPVNTGSNVVFLSGTASPPTGGVPSGGVILYADTGAFGFVGSSGNRVMSTGTTNTSASVGNVGPTIPGSCQLWLTVSVNGTTYRVPCFA